MNRKQEYLANFKLEELPAQYSNLADIIGFEATIDLVEAFGGEYVYIPKPDRLDALLRNRRLYTDYKKGEEPVALAKKYNLSKPHVYVIIDSEINLNSKKEK